MNQRTTLRLSLPSSFQVTDTTTDGTQRRLWTTGANPGVSYKLTRRDNGTVDLGSTITDAGAPRFLQTSVLVGWEHALAARFWSHLGAGVARVDTIKGDVPGTPAHFAIGNAGLRHQRQSGSESISFGLDARVDPVLGEIRPSASGSLRGRQELSRTVLLSSSLNAYTTATREPLDQSLNETSYGGDVTALWRVASMLRLRFGFRAQWFGPHWSEGIDPRQRTLLGVVGVSVFYPPER
jgi:hypothetical protein